MPDQTPETSIDEFARGLLDQKLEELLSQYDLGDEQEPLKELLKDLQAHAFDVGVYAANNLRELDEESSEDAAMELDDYYMLDRETLAKLILSTNT